MKDELNKIDRHIRIINFGLIIFAIASFIGGMYYLIKGDFKMTIIGILFAILFMLISGWKIRISINLIRSVGIPIASGRKGYYWAEDYTEIDETISSLESRVEKIGLAINGLKSIEWGEDDGKL